MKDKIKNHNYFEIGFTIFCVICACILFYFFLLRFDFFFGTIVKLCKILLPIFIGILIAYLLNPVVVFLEKKLEPILKEKIKDRTKSKRLNRVLSITITYIIVLIIIILIILFVIPSLIDSINVMLNNIPAYVNNIYNLLKDYIQNNKELETFVNNMNTNITDYVTNIVSPNLDMFMSNVGTGITNLISSIFNIIIGIIVSIYLLFDKETFVRNFKNVLKAILPDKAYDETIINLTYTNKIFGGFMMAKIIDSLIIGVLTFIVLTLFRIPYALVISAVVGITNIIPYFGPFIGAIPSFFLLLLISPKHAITFCILILLIQQLDGNVIGPKLIGNKTGIKSFWVLFSILLFGGLFGFVGMIFGVPVFAVIYSILENRINKKLAKKSKEVI